MKTLFFPFFFSLLWLCNAHAQDSAFVHKTVSDSISLNQELQEKIDSLSDVDYKRRQWLVGAASAALYGGSFYYLNKAWYQKNPQTSFHTFNDAREWLQVDKVGHAWTAYNGSRLTTAAWQWAGVRHEKAVLLGSATGFTYLSVIEILDAHSADWGWSWADMGANLFGSALFAAQELAWNDQKIQFKFSSHTKSYAPDLRPRADALFGPTLPERILKDYNGQTYWASFNVKGILSVSAWPDWLNIAVGYGADGLWGGFENVAFDEGGNPSFDRRDVARRRQWYLSPDIDLTKIGTNEKWVKTLLFAFNAIKVPAPALRYSGGKFGFHPLYF